MNSTVIRRLSILSLSLFATTVEAASVAPVAAEHGMVVTAQSLATDVGVEVLKKGGNAVDAAVVKQWRRSQPRPTTTTATTAGTTDAICSTTVIVGVSVLASGSWCFQQGQQCGEAQDLLVSLPHLLAEHWYRTGQTASINVQTSKV